MRVGEWGLTRMGASQLKRSGGSPGSGWGWMWTISPVVRSTRVRFPDGSVAALINFFHFIYWFTIIGLHLVAAGVLISQRKMLAGHRKRQAASPQAAVSGLESVPAPSSLRDRR